MEVDCMEQWISTPKYLNNLTTGMLGGSEAGSKDEFRGISWDLDQLIL